MSKKKKIFKPEKDRVRVNVYICKSTRDHLIDIGEGFISHGIETLTEQSIKKQARKRKARQKKSLNQS